jgi:hypothetical protein
VGHVNVAKYFGSLWNDPNVIQTHFLADWTHPNRLAHEVVYHILNDWIMKEDRVEPRPSRRPSSQGMNPTRPNYTWACGEDDDDDNDDDATRPKRLLRNLIEQRHVIASFTKETPKNNKMLPGMLLPRVDGNEDGPKIKVTKTNEMKTKKQTKKKRRNPVPRNSRQLAGAGAGVVVPCCGKSTLQVDNVSNHGILQGMQVTLYPDSVGLTLYFDHENVTDKFFRCRNRTEWQCIFSDIHQLFSDWVVLKAPRNVSTISMCNHQSTCGKDDATTEDLTLEGLTVYGTDEA